MKFNYLFNGWSKRCVMGCGSSTKISWKSRTSKIFRWWRNSFYSGKYATNSKILLCIPKGLGSWPPEDPPWCRCSCRVVRGQKQEDRHFLVWCTNWNGPQSSARNRSKNWNSVIFFKLQYFKFLTKTDDMAVSWVMWLITICTRSPVMYAWKTISKIREKQSRSSMIISPFTSPTLSVVLLVWCCIDSSKQIALPEPAKQARYSRM